ncbi:MAG: hypothetical protein WC969_09010 [Elusimicrobiota bacterium]
MKILPFLFAALLGPLAAQTPSSAPVPAQALQGQPPPTPGSVLLAPDGRFRWVEGEDAVFVRTDDGSERRVRLPSPLEKAARRRVLFAAGARHFCVLEEKDSDFGLHVNARKGAKNAKALLLSSTLRLIDERGRPLWARPLPEKAIVGKASEARILALAGDGTTAILLQDIDPYNKVRPLLMVFDARGRELRALDYAQWTRVDEFALSADGRALAVRGFGLVPEDADWSKAVGVYPLNGRAKPRIAAAPKAEESRELRGFDKDLWVCCVKEGGTLSALGPAGEKTPVDPAEADRRFGTRGR